MADSLTEKYIACMEEIKLRTEVVTSFVDNKINSKYLIPTAESAALQLRKILELIALSSLVANHEQYSSLRANFHRDWNAKRILETLDRVNPNFYPVPTSQVLISEGQYDTPNIESGYLTREEFEELYNTCSAILHSKNPFSEQDFDALSFLYKEVPEWMQKIIVLLNHHHVHPIDDSRMYIVMMQTQKDGSVQMAEFEKIDQ